MNKPEQICTNFTVARQFEDSDRVLAVREAISDLKQRRISRFDIDIHLQIPLSSSESAALFTCLQKNGAASQVSSEGGEFADYTFEVQIENSVQILTQQAAVIAAGPDDEAVGGAEVSFVATLPGGFESSTARAQRLTTIVDTIRSQIFDANESVRIANPYFDPSLEMIDDLASLPQRGIETRILTRETRVTGSDVHTSLNKMWDQIDSERRDLFEVGDLYEWDDERGSQSFATHAKMVIVDESVCYIGSANLTDTSLSSNFEFGVVVEGELVSEAVVVFDEVFDYARSVNLPL